jgi:hypothetical protein
MTQHVCHRRLEPSNADLSIPEIKLTASDEVARVSRGVADRPLGHRLVHVAPAGLRDRWTRAGRDASPGKTFV